MIIKWIDKKSVLKGNRKTFKAGDLIPAGFLEKARIKYLLSVDKIKIIEAPEENNPPENSDPVIPEKTDPIVPEKKKTKAQLKKEKKEAQDAMDLMNRRVQDDSSKG